MDTIIEQLNNEIDKIEEANVYKIDVLLKDNLKKLNGYLKKLNKIFSNILNE